MQKRIFACALSLICSLAILSSLTGCNPIGTYQDGVYTAQFENYDSNGYKDMIQVTVENNEVTQILYDAVKEDGTLRNYDAKYGEKMVEFQGTSPERYSKDLINQFMAANGIKGVDSVAGATYSSRCFISLYLALETNMVNQDESLLVVPNINEG